MHPIPTLAAVALLLGACTSLDEAREAAIVNSIRYDDVPCPQLIAERNAIAARNGLPTDAEREPMRESRLTGLGPFIPDIRNENTRARDTAIGQIDAINRSLVRRACTA